MLFLSSGSRLKTITSPGYLILRLLVAMTSIKTVVSAAEVPPPLISLPQGSTQATALQTLHRDTGKLVLSECPEIEHKNQSAIKELRLDELLPKLTAEYHLHGLVGAKEFLFVRRFWDPREEPDFPLEEIRAVVSDVHQLIEPLSPHFVNLQGSFERREFYRSLTPEQIERARRGELTYAMITSDQRKRWNMLTAVNAFDTPEYELRTSLAIYRNWSQCDTRWATVREPEQELPSLRFRYPIQTEAGFERHEFELLRPRPDMAAPQPGPAVGSLEPIEFTPHGRTSCSKRYRQLEQPSTLAAIVEAISEENQVEIRIPSYARERQYYLYSTGSSGEEVLKALAEINGWEIYETGKRQYALDRPRVTRPRDYPEAHRILRSLIPPVMRTLLEAPSEESETKRARALHSWSILQEYLERQRKWNTGFRVTDLDAEQQRRLANRILLGRGLARPLQILIKRQAPAWLVAPERGFFKLDGEIGPGKHPSLEFYVLREKQEPTSPGAGPLFVFDTWGWLVNSSSLGD